MTAKIFNQHKILILILLAAGFIVYSPVLQAPFKTLDDNFSIVNNDQIGDLTNIKSVFTTSFFKQNHYYRPLVQLSFMIEHHFFGLNAGFYHFTNLLLHLLMMLAVFGLTFRLLKDRKMSFFAALLFAVHPINSESVWNIPDRAILLAGLFSLLTFLAFLKGKNSLFWSGISWLTLPLAMLSKESAALFPFVLTAYCFFVECQMKFQLKTLVRRVTPYFLILAGYIVLRKYLGFVEVYQPQSLQWLTLSFISFLRSLFTYTRLIIFPIDLHFDRSRAIFDSFLQPELILTLLAFCILVGILIKKRRKIPALIWFLIVWIAIEYFPVSQLITSIGVSPGQISTAEHFCYIPSIPAFTLLVLIIRRLTMILEQRQPVKSRGLQSAGFVFLIFFGLLTYQQATLAQNPLLMFKKSSELNPNNGRVLQALGLELAKTGQLVEAEQTFRRELTIDPMNVEARISLGKSLCDQEKYLECLNEYDRIQDAGFRQELLDHNKKETVTFILSKYLEKLKVEPQNADLLFSAGVMSSRLGMTQEAEDYYDRALEINGQHINALFNVSMLLIARGADEEAIIKLEYLLNLLNEPENPLSTLVEEKLKEAKGRIQH